MRFISSSSFALINNCYSIALVNLQCSVLDNLPDLRLESTWRLFRVYQSFAAAVSQSILSMMIMIMMMSLQWW